MNEQPIASGMKQWHQGWWRLLLAAAVAVASFSAGNYLGGSATMPDQASAEEGATPGEAATTTSGASAAAREALARIWSLTQEPPSPWRTYDLGEQIRLLEKSQFPAVAESARKLAPKDRKTLLPLLLARWNELDPEALKEWAWKHAARAGGRYENAWDSSVAKAWLAVAPEAGIERARKANTLGSPASARAWMEKIFEEARRGEIPKIPDAPTPKERDVLRGYVITNIANFRPKLALEIYRQREQSEPDLYRLMHIAASLSEEEPDLAAEIVREQLASEPFSYNALYLMAAGLEKVAERDPMAAFELVEKLPEEWQSWGRDAVEMIAAEKMPVPVLMRAHEAGDVVRPRGRKPVHFESRFRYDSLAGIAAKADPAGTLKWVWSLPAGEERSTVLGQIFPLIPVAGTEEFLAMSPEWQWEHAPEMAKRLIESEPAVRARIQQEVPMEVRLRLIEGEWAERRDAKQGSPWRAVPAGPERDAALMGAIMAPPGEPGKEGYETEVRLARQIGDAETRARAMRRIALWQVNADREKGRQWMAAESGLDAGTQEEVLLWAERSKKRWWSGEDR
jgi:hypothetical protein